MTNDAPTTAEIDDYVNGQLDVERRFAVEMHLARQPALAAQVMGDLSSNSALKLLSGRMNPPPESLAVAMRQLNRGIRAGFWNGYRLLSAGALVAATVVAGLFLGRGGPPSYVDYAVSSYRIAALRANMHSQIESPIYDAHEIASQTHIAMPRLPADWGVTDVQLFPTDRGPALVVVARTAAGQQVSLFVVHERTGAPERPDATRRGAQSVAYWRRGDMSYALTGETEPAAIDATAEALARGWS